jgi:outer membrane lipoprotein-sorting protein
MRRLRTFRLAHPWALLVAALALLAGAGIAQAALGGGAAAPPAKPLDRAALAALRAPDVAGITARIRFTNNLLPSGSLPTGSGSPVLSGATGRLWLRADGRFRLELQSDAGDAQVTSDGERLSLYDSGSNTVYRATLPEERRKDHEAPTLAGVREALTALTRTWTVSGAQPGTTAGRPSYTVRISPKDDGGLLGAAELAWDAEHGVPLRAAVYAQGQADPVLALEATSIDFGAVPLSSVATTAPAGARVVDVDAKEGRDAHGRGGKSVRGAAAVQRRLDFELAAPERLAGLARTDVRLARDGDRPAAVTRYGEGLGSIFVLQSKAGREERKQPGGVRLPEINIDGATGTELATALGTLVTFERDGVRYVVAGLVPPLSAENAARGLR